jgi:hypothetical protein
MVVRPNYSEQTGMFHFRAGQWVYSASSIHDEPGSYLVRMAPWSTALLEKIIAAQLVNKISASRETRRFITVFTVATL